MASGAAALALNATIVAAVLAVLVLPSLGRCPSLGPEPPTPVPAPRPSPGPAPGPPISCDDCRSHCYSNCSSSVPLRCRHECDIQGSCDQCRTEVIRQCTADRNTGQGGFDCDGFATTSCIRLCSGLHCSICTDMLGKQCEEDCTSECKASCA